MCSLSNTTPAQNNENNLYFTSGSIQKSVNLLVAVQQQPLQGRRCLRKHREVFLQPETGRVVAAIER